MLIRAGYQIVYDCPQPTPMLLMVSLHPSRVPDLVEQGGTRFDPPLAAPLGAPLGATEYTDGFGNVCTRLLAPAGRLTISTTLLIRDGGLPDPVSPAATETPVPELPDEVLVFLLGSRYCDTDRLSDLAWTLFGNTPPGWERVQAVCDYAHDRIGFDYQRADATRSAREAHDGRQGVCRDYAHLAVALCRCLNIPARYCTGYLGDMGTPQPWGVPDFAAWFEAYLGGAWHTFDARNNQPRIGRILMARGRDATDVAIATTFGPCTLAGFSVVTDEVAA
ncbi:transglutaminase family protein [Roseomonas sp. NAR14]|uniref:Transglutaminase family protein n=1 Tax=Roseomonas acroporae TaxID=2937791 RepID=A0A9X1Y3B9_9PROT|nr:transglutaminase family protein [Roseomonas acroporae]MCK8783159.1 transglutaminase family protein [Roseomonas acroporae]